jgi:guanine nucleotide exchange factor VAV
MDGELKVRYDRGAQQRHIFVLDQLMIICKSARGESSYVYANSLILKKFELDDNVTKEWGTFWFVLSDRMSKESFSFGAKKQEIAQKWISAIKIAKDNMSPQFSVTKLHTFSMYTFNEPTICDVCRKLLRGVFFQGYRCAKTNMAVHKECLEKAKDMPGRPTIPPKLPSRPSFRAERSRISTGRMYAISNYDGTPPPIGNRPPLLFEKNDVIEIYSEDGDFYEGALNGREGFFPKSFVQRRPQRTASYESTMFDGRRGSVPVLVGPCGSPVLSPIRNSFCVDPHTPFN